MRRLGFLLALLAIPAASATADDLRGSRASMRHQHEVAVEQDFTFLRTPSQVREFVEEERLVEVADNEHLVVNKVSFPYTRPVVKLFLERLAEQFHRATGDKLVVTSLTRPKSLQPRNASPYSVHPAGIALDLRVPASSAQRAWIEETLLGLEGKGLLDVTRERRPPHYHVAVFPEQYQTYVDKLISREIADAAVRALESATQAVQSAVASTQNTHPSAALPLALVITLGGALLMSLTTGGLLVRHAVRQRR